jgi:hypothetical protein
LCQAREEGGEEEKAHSKLTQWTRHATFREEEEEVKWDYVLVLSSCS